MDLADIISSSVKNKETTKSSGTENTSKTDTTVNYTNDEVLNELNQIKVILENTVKESEYEDISTMIHLQYIVKSMELYKQTTAEYKWEQYLPVIKESLLFLENSRKASATIDSGTVDTLEKMVDGRIKSIYEDLNKKVTSLADSLIKNLS